MGHDGTIAAGSLLALGLAVGVLVAVAMPAVLVVVLLVMPRRNGPPTDPREVPKVSGGRGFPVVLRDDSPGPERR